MVKKKTLFRAIILVVFAISFSSAFHGQTKTETTKSSGSISGETYRYKYSNFDFAETPSWKSEEGEPPISVSRAVSVARSNLSRFVVGAEKFKLEHLLLMPAGNDKWFYKISFVSYDAPNGASLTRQFSIIVKMDGTLLEPKKIVEVD